MIEFEIKKDVNLCSDSYVVLTLDYMKLDKEIGVPIPVPFSIGVQMKLRGTIHNFLHNKYKLNNYKNEIAEQFKLDVKDLIEYRLTNDSNNKIIINVEYSRTKKISVDIARLIGLGIVFNKEDKKCYFFLPYEVEDEFSELYILTQVYYSLVNEEYYNEDLKNLLEEDEDYFEHIFYEDKYHVLLDKLLEKYSD